MKVQGFELRCYEKVTTEGNRRSQLGGNNPQHLGYVRLNQLAILASQWRNRGALNYIKLFNILKSMKIQGFETRSKENVTTGNCQ